MLTLRAGLALLTALLGVHGTVTVTATAAAADLPTLLATLKRHGFSVVQQQPPGGTAYGLFDADRKLLMIAPITHDLGIARHVLLHEAVHAAQSCPDGRMRLIGWSLSTSPAVASRIRYLITNHYQQGDQTLEQEAFLMQSQPNAETLIVKALNQRC